MAEVIIKSAFIEEQVGSPTFVLKVAEPHSKKDEQGNWQTVSRTFFDVKVSKDSQINLGRFSKGDRVSISGTQKTEVREHQGKKYYTLTIWADRIEAAQGAQNQWATQTPAGGAQGSQNQDAPAFGGGSDGFDQSPF